MSEEKGEIKRGRAEGAVESAAEGRGGPAQPPRAPKSRRAEGPRGRRAEEPKGRRAEGPKTLARGDWSVGRSEESASDWQARREPGGPGSAPRVKRPRCQEAAGKPGPCEGGVFPALGRRGVQPDRRRRVAAGRLRSPRGGVDGAPRTGLLGRGRAPGRGRRRFRGPGGFAARACRGGVAGGPLQAREAPCWPGSTRSRPGWAWGVGWGGGERLGAARSACVTPEQLETRPARSPTPGQLSLNCLRPEA